MVREVPVSLQLLECPSDALYGVLTGDKPKREEVLRKPSELA